MKNKLLTIDVSHGTTHDGPGMRTTVFVKGCSLHCAWCQNPESICRENEIWWNQKDCIGCGTCKATCKNDALSLTEYGISIDRNRCIKCGNCTEVCPTDAMSWQGQEYTMEELLKEILKDRNYYKHFGGGVTCSGGEPLLQYAFVAELFDRLRSEGISTALDTCGCAPTSNLDAVLPLTDYILYDMKLIDSKLHKEYTGVSNELILENLIHTAEYVRNINAHGSERKREIWIRTPLIPGITSELENIRGIGSFIKDNISDVVSRWELCAFNGICINKYDKLGVKWRFANYGPMTQAEIAPIRQTALSLVPEEKLLISGMIRT